MKILFLDYWFKIYLWKPEMDLGYYTAYYDAVEYHSINLWLFSVEWADCDIYHD